jgi:ABC-2 type transport system permease protein
MSPAGQPRAGRGRGMSGLDGMLLVARREMATRIRDRAFQVGLMVTLLILLGVIVLPKVLGGDNNRFSVGLLGTAGRLQPALGQSAAAAGVTLEISRPASRAEAEAQVRDGRLDAVLDGDREIVVKRDLDNRLAAVVQSAHQQVVGAQRLGSAGIDPARVAAALSVAPLAVDQLNGEDKASGRKQAVALFAVLFLYGQMFGYAMWVALGVVEEKASRVVELLLATLRPWQLLAGKVAGIGVLGLLQFLVLGMAGVTAGLATGALSVPGEALGTIAHVLVWFVLGYAFYACLAAAVAARVSRQEDLQSAIGPLQVLLMGSFFLAIYAAQQPLGRMAGMLSFVPPFSAMLMPLRVAAGGAGPAQVAAALLVMLLATAALVRLAGWIYAGAVLRTGSKVPLADALRSGRAHRVTTAA